MDLFNLWSYKKLENDEEQASCFQLRNFFKKNLKTKLTQNDFKNKILVEEFSLADEHQKIIRKLKARQEKSKLTKNKCNDSILKGLKTLLRSKSKNEQNLIKKTENNRNGSVTHFQVQPAHLINKTPKSTCYLRAGVYEVFGMSCEQTFLETTSDQHNRVPKTPPAEDLGKNVWFRTGRFNKEDLKSLEEQPGSFSVCEDEKSGRFILSLRTSNDYKSATKIANYKIRWSAKGYQIKGFSKEFPSIESLVIHHSVMSEKLPVTLNLPKREVINNDIINKDAEI